MAKKRRRRARKRQAPPKLERPRAGTLVGAATVAAVHALWAAFLWYELVDARRGGDAFCAFGSGQACAAVWDSPFAVAVQRWSGLPIAGWGLAWSLVAVALPLLARRRKLGGGAHARYWSATLMNASGGVAAVLLLATASLASGWICTDCVITYVLVLAHAAICVRDLEPPLGERVLRGLPIAALATVAAFALLLYPGLKTPPARNGPDLGAIRAFELGPESTPRDELLARFLRSLRASELQTLSDALAAYALNDARTLRPARSLIGPANAPVRLTEFSDTLCGHCADLHQTLVQLRARLPSGSFSIEPRQFPLDGACNPHIPREAETPVRCTAAKALICAEGNQYAFDFAGALFKRRTRLTEQRIYELAAPYHLSRESMAACIDAPATQAKLLDDIAWAMEYEFPGTPLVLLNGRKAAPVPTFLYAILLAEGNPDHPLFASLPSARALAWQ